MSTNTPQGPVGDPEFLGTDDSSRNPHDGPDPAAGRRTPARRWGVLGGVSLGVVAVVGLGGWAAIALLAGGGAQPADAIPASAIGYASLDLDPNAAQKLEAFAILKKFPAIEKDLDVGSRDDLRRWVFEQMQADGTCTKLDYESDVAPWVGERVALAAVPAKDGKVAPLLALQVSDPEAAKTGMQALSDCQRNDESGFVISGDYALLAETTKLAEGFADDARTASLADDEQFQASMDAVGDAGVVTMYAAPGAPRYLMDLQHEFLGLSEPPMQAMGGPDEGRGQPMEIEPAPDLGRMDEQMQALYEDFEGAAAVVRFVDGAVEVEFAGKGLPGSLRAGGSEPGITTIPTSTAAAVSVAFSDGWLTDYLDQMATLAGGEKALERELAKAEAETGLTLPEDLETLLGESVTLSVDADFDVEALGADPSGTPAGIKVHGDPDEILPIVEKLRAAVGPEAEPLVVESGDGVVAFALNRDYAAALVDVSGLGESESFQSVVPDAEQANAVFYVNFDAGDGWLEGLAESFDAMGEQPANAEGGLSANLAPLDALGVSGWEADDVQHGLFRLTTD